MFQNRVSQVVRNLLLLAIFASILTACTPEQTVPAIAADVQNTAVAIVSTGVSLTQTAVPTSTLTPTATFALPTPSPIPTQPPPPILTPDAIQVERWKEYQTALAKSILPMFPFEYILCEWDILARSSQEVYVWAVCSSSKGDDSRPAIIHLGADGSVHTVEVLERGSSSDIDRMFPKEAQTKFSFYIGDSIFDGRLREMYNHLVYREADPEEPPLIVLSATLNP